MSEAAEVRLATAADVSAILLIRKDAWTEHATTYRGEPDKDEANAVHFLLTVGGEPAGSVRVRIVNDQPLLERLSVRHRYRSFQRILALVRAALDYCWALGYDTAIAFVMEDNAPVWLRLGARIIGPVDPWKGVNTYPIAIDRETASPRLRTRHCGPEPIVT